MANNTLLASDTFASGSLAAGWAIATGSHASIVSSGPPYYAEPPDTTHTADNVWTGLVWPNDQISEFTVQTFTTVDTSTTMALWTRLQASTLSGYVVNINNNAHTLQIYRCDSGSFAALGSVVSSLPTVVTGDVITFMSAGAIHTAYINGKRITWTYDATYASGSPGFRQAANANITHCQVASWRGYSAVQQDGIWQKQGTVIPALAGDLGASGSVGVYQLSNLFSGAAVLLSGTVIYGWASAGTPPGSIYYYESSDGVTFTRSAAAVLSGYANPFVILVAGTYYMYVQAANGQGSTNILLYTSTDRQNWSQQSTNILAPGGGGTWDATNFFDFQPIAIVSGTWYALYTGGAVGGLTLSTGLATSSDGLTWAKYGSNPIIAGAVNCGAIAKVGSTYYLWTGANQPGQFSGTLSSFRPFEIVRYKCSDPTFVTWTKDAHSAHRSQPYECLNYSQATCGGAFPNSIIDVGGKAYLYIQENPADGANPSVQQISLAIAPVSIASVVTQNEDAVKQVAADAFTSGNGDLSANWTTPTGYTKLKIISGPYVEATATATVCAMRYTGKVFAASHYSEVTIHALGTNGIAEPAVCMQANGDLYNISLLGATGTLIATFQIFKNVSGVATAIGPAVGFTAHVGDVIRLSITVAPNGNNILSAYQNEFQILQVEDPSNALSGGAPGMILYAPAALADAQVSAWAGGNANVVPAYSSSGSWVQGFRNFVNKR